MCELPMATEAAAGVETRVGPARYSDELPTHSMPRVLLPQEYTLPDADAVRRASMAHRLTINRERILHTRIDAADTFNATHTNGGRKRAAVNPQLSPRRRTHAKDGPIF